MRAISILMVILYHLTINYNIVSPPVSYLIIFDGQFGVNVFFVISGFLITTLLIEEENRTSAIALKKFYTRRILRIFPAYYFLLFIYFLLTRIHLITISLKSWITALTFTKYYNWGVDWYTAHAWSLSIEEQFYLFWPLLFIKAKRIRIPVLFAIIIAVPLLKVYIHTHHPIPRVDNLTIFLRMDAIATGCLFAFYRELLLEKYRLNRKVFFYTAVGMVLLLPTLMNLGAKNTYLNSILLPFGTSFGTIANLSIALIMLFSVFGPTGPWFKFLNSKVMNQIGLWSFSIYLWQQLFICKTSFTLHQLPLSLSLLTMCALFSYYCIERPFLRIKRRFSV